MSKYQEALDVLSTEIFTHTDESKLEKKQAKDILQELVDKETPKKPSWLPNNRGNVIDCCPSCKGRIKLYKDNYCPKCGQRLE